MRWKGEATIPERLGYTIVVVLAPLWVPALAMFLALTGLLLLKRKAVGPVRDWSLWFAWYPVRVGFNETAWFELVERRSFGVMSDIEYRSRAQLTPNTSSH